MDDFFDPYHVWLGIPPEDQPADHYRLLGIKVFESSQDVIANAADRQMGHLRTFQTGIHGAESQRLLNEVATARVCLLNPSSKAAYDTALQQRLQSAAEAPTSVPALPPLSPTIESRGAEWVTDGSLTTFGLPQEFGGFEDQRNDEVPAELLDRVLHRPPPMVPTTPPFPDQQRPSGPYPPVPAPGRRLSQGGAPSSDSLRLPQPSASRKEALSVRFLTKYQVVSIASLALLLMALLAAISLHGRRSLPGTPTETAPVEIRWRKAYVSPSAISNNSSEPGDREQWDRFRTPDAPISLGKLDGHAIALGTPLTIEAWDDAASDHATAERREVGPHAGPLLPSLAGFRIGPNSSRGSGAPLPGTAAPFDSRHQANRELLISIYGGTKATERAVAGGLNWLARHQNPDGSWSITKYHLRCKDKTCSGAGSIEADAGATALALLPFLAAGQTHQSKGYYQKQVAKAVQWILNQQKPDGDLAGRAHQPMYSHGLCTIALCELVGMTGDSQIRHYAERALKFIETGQNAEGGWRYTHSSPESDMSVLGWQMMAFECGEMAGIPVNKETLGRAMNWMNRMSVAPGQYRYRTGAPASPSMSALAILIQQAQGVARTDPTITCGVKHLMRNAPNPNERDTYYWYYATQVLRNMVDADWDAWNRKMREILLETQNRDIKQCAVGSWDPNKPTADRWGKPGGRLITTCLSILPLQVYYRYLPLDKLHPVGSKRGAPEAEKPLAASFSLAASSRCTEFLQALLSHDYADMAVEYLDHLQKNSQTSPALREVLDIERCNAFLLWARNSSDPKVAQQRVTQARACLARFTAEHPRDPRIAPAIARFAEQSYHAASPVLNAARYARSTGGQVDNLGDAQHSLQQAANSFDEAADCYSRWRAQLAAQAAQQNDTDRTGLDRQEHRVDLGWVEAQVRAGIVYYHHAELLDDDNEKRRELLRKAADRFDAIYQASREDGLLVCLVPHLWHARMLQELGQAQDAEIIFDEVLAAVPSDDPKSIELASLWAQTVHFQLLSKRPTGDPRAFMDDGGKWLADHAKWRETPGYQGFALDVAKARLKLVELQPHGDASKLYDQAIAELEAIGKVRTEYQQDAILFRRLVQKVHRQDRDLTKLINLGDSAAGHKQWDEAEKEYTQAMKLAKDRTLQEGIAECERRLRRVRYAKALGLLMEGKHEESLQAATQLSNEMPEDPSSPRAALLAVSAAAALCTKAGEKERPKARERLEKMTQLVAQTWPGRPEVDEAWLLTGKTLLELGDRDGATAALVKVSAESPHRAAVLFTIGQVHWQTYIEENNKKKVQAPPGQLKNHLAKALENLEAAVRRWGTSLQETSTDNAMHLAECQVLLAWVLMEDKQHGKALALLEPIVRRIKAQRPNKISQTIIGFYIAAIHSHLATGNVAAASEATSELLDITAEPWHNDVLVSCARLFIEEYERCNAMVSTKSSIDRQESPEAPAVLRVVLGRILRRLLKGERLSPNDEMYVGVWCERIGMNDEAMAQFDRVLQEAQKRPKDSKREAITSDVRTRFVTLLRNRGQFTKASEQVNLLIAEERRRPRAMMEKARILHDWSVIDPSRRREAVRAWSTLASQLQKMTDPYSLSEQFEIQYNLALCQFHFGSQETAEGPRERLLKDAERSLRMASQTTRAEEQKRLCRQLADETRLFRAAVTQIAQ